MERSPTGSPRTVRLGVTLGALTILLVVIFQLRTAPGRYLDQDELEHLNASWLVSQGETLYGSIFENHPPGMVLLLQPVVRATQRPEVMIRAARYGALTVALATLFAVGWVATSLGGLPFGTAAVVLLATHTFFVQKATEVRPDGPALLLLVLALALLVLPSATKRAPRAFAAGALFCVAGLFTPKVIYAAAGAALGSALAAASAAERARTGAALRALGWIALGAATVAGIAALEMSREGILRGFFADAVAVSLRMRIDDPSAFRIHYLLATLRANPATWALAAAGLIFAVRSRGRPSPAPLCVLATSLAGGVAGLFLIDAPLRQYFLTFLVPVAFFGAWGGAWVVGSAARLRQGAAAIAFAGLLAAVLVPAWIELRGERSSMDDQLAVLAEVLALTGRGDRVFDCWTGLFLTRRPAYRYFYLNSDVQRLFEPAVLETELLRALRNPEVRLAIADQDCAGLPSGVQHYVQSDFAPVADWPFLYLRRADAPERGR